MATNTYILNNNDFTNRTDLSPNIAESLLNGNYATVQELELTGVLCKALYDDYLDNLNNLPLTTENEALEPYIKDFLVWAVMMEYYPIAGLKSTPAGMRKHQDTISTEVEPAKLDILTKRAESKKTSYKKRLLDFLEDNKNDYPLWRDSSCNNCQKAVNFLGGVRFGSRKLQKTPIKYT